MRIELQAQVPGDGRVALRWRTEPEAHAVHLLILRTGAVPAHTALLLSGDTREYEIAHLSRHQRYLMAVAAADEDGLALSAWYSITPRAGFKPLPTDRADILERNLARVHGLTVMPQEERLTAWWRLGGGFVDRVVLEVWQGEDLLHRASLEPEVTSLSLDAARGLPLQNGQVYGLVLRSEFAGILTDGPAPAQVVPAPQGQERQANLGLDRGQLVYPSLSLGDEVRIFEDEEDPAAPGAPASGIRSIVCGHCGREVSWQSWRLVCPGCGAEYIPNGRGDYLDVARLRFGTCTCCLPKKILIQKAGSPTLACAHSGKEHIRAPGQQGYRLIEDLPYGLCQCCRPRRPLIKKAGRVRCSRSDEEHRNEAGRWVLLPSQPVFDASAIDALLDAGLAEICSTGVSSARPEKPRRKS